MTPTLDEHFYEMVKKHHEDLYEGRGRDNPPLCTRMELAEKEIEMMNKAAEEIRKDSKAIKFLVIGTALTVIGEIIVKLLVH